MSRVQDVLSTTLIQQSSDAAETKALVMEGRAAMVDLSSSMANLTSSVTTMMSAQHALAQLIARLSTTNDLTYGNGSTDERDLKHLKPNV